MPNYETLGWRFKRWSGYNHAQTGPRAGQRTDNADGTRTDGRLNLLR